MCVGCQTVKKGPKVLKPSECGYLYTELSNLDLQILDLFEISKSDRHLEINKILRSWINKLQYECPPQVELNLIRDYIADEYPKYFPNNFD